MRRWALVAALFAGCYRPATEATCTVTCPTGLCPSGMSCGTDGICRTNDADDCSMVDAPPPPPDGMDPAVCVGQGLLKNLCFRQPTAPVMPAAGTLSTVDDSNCTTTHTQADGTKLCILAGTFVVIDGILRVTGPNPVVFVGLEHVTINAMSVLDVSSRSGDLIAGAGGAENKGCAPPLTLGGSDGGGAGVGGGGAGATFQASGADGGAGQGGTAVPGGTAALNNPVPIIAVRGGCTGGPGGNGSPGSGGRSGLGGGAVYLISNGAIRIYGTINASGAGGGRPGVMSGGGGGGGSGGMIGLDAPAYDIVNAKVFAVGGSGAAGASSNVGGVAGREATGPMPPGQTTTSTGAGYGGSGGAFTGADAGTAASLGGGGGGGGGAGYIGMTNLGQLPVSTFAPNPVAMN